jgi:glycerate-2-kinase
VTLDLLRAGAAIGELNAVRKHLSAVKGGRLAQAAFPAAVVNLVISDVLDNELETIASGPSHWDPTTFRDAQTVLEKFHLWEKAPASVREHIEKGIQGGEGETVKETDPVFEKVHTFIVGDNTAALRAAEAEAQRLGFETLILTSSDRGEARRAAVNYVSFLANMACSAAALRKPLCFLVGGELTVSVTGSGLGGRNMEFVLAAALEAGKEDLADIFCAAGCLGKSTQEAGIEGPRPLEWLILSAGTDGIDGPTDAAGAWIGPAALERIAELGLNPQLSLRENDSYTFFKKTGNLIITGPSGTNVMDIRIFLLGPAQKALR